MLILDDLDGTEIEAFYVARVKPHWPQRTFVHADEPCLAFLRRMYDCGRFGDDGGPQTWLPLEDDELHYGDLPELVE